MQMCGSTNKSPIKLRAAENKLTRWFIYEWEKPTRQKLHRVILRSLSQESTNQQSSSYKYKESYQLP